MLVVNKQNLLIKRQTVKSVTKLKRTDKAVKLTTRGKSVKKKKKLTKSYKA